MGKIFCIMGKSGTGKDTVLHSLLERKDLGLVKIIPYTTRPRRTGEEDGAEYHFCSSEDLKKMESEGRVIECRTYHTMHGEWDYFTVDDGQIDLEKADYAVIGTLPVCEKLRNYYSKEQIVPIYIEVDDGVRLSRALGREKKQHHPKYEEMCRRFLADAEDFSEERLKEAEVIHRFSNSNFEKCLDQIVKLIESETGHRR